MDHQVKNKKGAALWKKHQKVVSSLQTLFVAILNVDNIRLFEYQTGKQPGQK